MAYREFEVICYPDHLGTPRAITTSDASNAKVWEWKNDDPFGNNAPNENPSALGAFNYNNRFPGQYFDQETNSSYNYFRDYDPTIGRYVQSDPIGLVGGISTYGYVSGNPLTASDSRGLRDVIVAIWTTNFTGYLYGDGSAGHVYLGELDGTVLTSQFPSPHGLEGINTPLSAVATIAKEGRLPDYVYKVSVPNDAEFDKEVARQRGLPTWYFWPDGTKTTQCAAAATSALRAGGVKGIASGNPRLPNYLNSDLQLKILFGSGASLLPFTAPTNLKSQ